MPELNFLQDLLVLFGLGVIAVVAFHRLNLPPVLGFLITGVVCGPYGFKMIDDLHSIEALAEIGLVLLLFTIGIEFSVQTFLRIKRFLLIAGGLQIGLTMLATMGVSYFFAVPWATATFIGMLIALSSTAIVVRTLEYRGDIDTAHGRAAISILIFQDLCIVPMVLLTPFLGGKETSLTEVGLIMGKALLFLVLAASVARYLVPWLLNQVAKTRRREAFVLSIILLCLGTAAATSHVGLSMALGAFIAGLLISESKYSHQALAEVLPFREVFNCLVFVSIGMMFDIRIIMTQPLAVAGGLALVIAVKALIAGGVTKLMGHSLRVAILTGFALAQVSEFSFVLAKMGLSVGLLDEQSNQLFLAVAILSMFFTPGVINAGARLYDRLERLLPQGWITGIGESDVMNDSRLSDHVIIVGFGVNGRNLARALDKVGIRYVVIEQDPVLVRAEKAGGTPIFYGDSARQEVLAHAGIAHARALALTVSDANSTLRSAELARRLNPDVRVVARARYIDEVEPLIKVGTQDVVPEEFVSSVELFSRVLNIYAVPADMVERCVSEARSEWVSLQSSLEKKHLSR